MDGLVSLDDILLATASRDKNALERMTGKKIDVPIFFRMPLPHSFCIFRTKAAEDIDKYGCNITYPDTFSYVPQEVNNPLGRMNYPGQSIFYGSLKPQTNFAEIGNGSLSVGKMFFVSKWTIKANKDIDALTLIRPENISDSITNAKDIYISDSVVLNKYGEGLKTLSELFLKNDSQNKNENHLASAIIANCFYGNVEAIWYPSVANDKNEFLNANVAILPNVVDDKMELVSVVRGELLDDLASLRIMAIGFNVGGTIDWHNIDVDYDNIMYTANDVISEDGKCYHLRSCKIETPNGSMVSINDIQKSVNGFHRQIIKAKVINDICSKVFDNFCNYNSYNEIKDEIEIYRTQDLIDRYIRKRGKLKKAKNLLISGVIPVKKWR